MVVMAVFVCTARFYFYAGRAQAVRFNHVMTQSEAHFGRQRVHDVFHPFRTLFFYHPQRSQINIAEV